MSALQEDLNVDRSYQQLSTRVMQQADQRARQADVRGIVKLLSTIQERDRALGAKRPDAVTALVSAVQAQLDAARQLRLARDHWAERAPDLLRYSSAISAPVDVLALFTQLQPLLEDIKSLAGSPPAALVAIRIAVERIVKRMAAVAPPTELRAAHALLVSAAQMADNAALIRREAALRSDLSRAWDASSAAAGALMLAARARSEIQLLLRPPQLR